MKENLSIISLYIAIFSGIIAIISFIFGLLNTFKNRPRIACFLNEIQFHNKPDNAKRSYLQITTCNLGFRPIILKDFYMLGKNNLFTPGHNDMPAIEYRIKDRKLPTILQPGDSFEMHPMRSSIFNSQNKTDNPYLYFIFIDSFNRIFLMDLNTGFNYKITSCVINFFKKRIFLIWELKKLLKMNKIYGFMRCIFVRTVH